MENKPAITTKKRSIGKRIGRLLLFSALCFVCLFFVAIAGAYWYLQSNEKKILEQVELLNQGDVSFEQAEISLWRDFPQAAVVIRKVKLVDSMYQQHQTPILLADELIGTLSLKNWRKKQFAIKSLTFKKGAFYLHKDQTGYSNLKGIFQAKDTTSKVPPLVKVNMKHLIVNLKEFDFHITDEIKSTSIHGTAKTLTAQLFFQDAAIKANIAMDMAMKEMVFKKEKGAFIANSRVKGRFDATLQDKKITIEPFDLKVNEHDFKFSGDIFADKSAPDQLILENQKTDFVNILPLLPIKTRKKIKPYRVLKPFYTKTTITLHPNVPAFVTIDFDMPHNKVLVRDLIFRQASIKGKFINRIYDDKRAFSEGRKNIRLELYQLQAKYKGFQLKTKDALITSTPTTKGQIKAIASISGKAKSISQWFENERFFFDKGNFNLRAGIDGSLNDMDQIIIDSYADLEIEDLSVVYQPADAVFPLQSLVLHKKSGAADFSIVSGTLANNRSFQLDGGLSNVSSLLIDLANETTTSVVDFKSNRLGWRDFINLFGESGYLKDKTPKTERAKKQSMKAMLKGIERNFRPTLSLNIDTVTYYNIHLHDFKTGVHFENERVLILEKTSFNVGRGRVQLNAKLDITDPYRTGFEFELHTHHLNLRELLPALNYFDIKLLKNMEEHPSDMNLDIKIKGVVEDAKGLIPNSTEGEIQFKTREIEGKILLHPKKTNGTTKLRKIIQLKGTPYAFNHFFNHPAFNFSDQGIFQVVFDYDGELTSIEALLNDAKIDFTMRDAVVDYVTADVIFPLKKLDLSVEENIGDFAILIHPHTLPEPFTVDGKVINISEMILGNAWGNRSEEFQTIVNVRSSTMEWGKTNTLFRTTAKRSLKAAGTKRTGHKMRNMIKGILNNFNPTLRVEIDNFIFSDKLQLQNFKTQLDVKNQHTILLKNTGCKFHGGAISLDAAFDLSANEETPFTANCKTKDLDVVRLLESLDYLGIRSLQDAKKLAGKLNMQLDIKSVLAKNSKTLIKDKTTAVVDFDLRDVEVLDLELLNTIAAKAMKKRLPTVRFAPLTNTVTFKENIIAIPQMEIQSNVVNLFVEGEVNLLGQGTSVWFSIPLDNLKKKDKSIIPKKRGYAATRDKVHLEVTMDKRNHYKTKLHISKKKFYKQRGILEQYKADKEKYRRIRKQLKQMK